MSDPTNVGSSFFHLSGTAIGGQACQGTACFVAGHLDPTRARTAGEATPRVYCLGKCYAAPATAADRQRPTVEVATPTPVVLERIARGDSSDLAAYTDHGGYASLARALDMGSESVVAEIEASGLRGRGGAAFATGRKCRTVLEGVEPKYVVCNADEGDPGAYIDRFLLEDDPHTVLEGMAIAAVAVQAARGYVYVRKEYPDARAAVARAIAEARAAGIFGERLLGRGSAFDVEIVDGEGSYVCGEETALLNAIEGRRPEVRARPPYPAEYGLHGRPTLVNNVETLAALPWLLRHGAAEYAAMGHGTSRGTKVVSLNSLFVRPGLYEVEFGVPVAEIVSTLGGGLRGGELRGVLIGGPLAGILPPHLLDTPFAVDELRQVGADVGHGGVVAFDEHTSIAALVHHVFRFGAFESCGKCTPCRVGARRVEDLFATTLAGDRLQAGASAEWRDVVDALAATSLCGHGTGLAAFARSALAHYGEELRACLG